MKGGNGQTTKKGFDEDEDEDDDEQVLDLDNPIQLADCPWLPTPEWVEKLVLRDPEAWGYDEEEDTFDAEKMAFMNEMMWFWWDVVIPRIAGHAGWGPKKRCYNLLSTARDDPTHGNPNPKLWISPSDEALGVLAIENFYDRWVLRAKYGINNPDLKIYKDKDGAFLKELKGLKTKYSSPNGGQQPHGGLTEAGVKRLTKLTEMIRKNRKDNKEMIKRIEEGVLKIVYKRNGRKRIDENAKKGRKKEAPKMAKLDSTIRWEDIDMDDNEY